MDTRTLQFIQAVIGADGARALAKAASKSVDLEWALLPRVIMAWLDVVSNAEYDTHLPGVEDTKLSLTKSEQGLTGHINIGPDVYAFRDVTLEHVAGSVAVALGIDPNQAPELRSPNFAKLGKSIDVLVKSRTLRKAKEELEKASWNAKMRRRYRFDPETQRPVTEPAVRQVKKPQGGYRPHTYERPVALSDHEVEQRRKRYAESIGLQPENSATSWAFPRAQGNTLPYGSDFDVAHETAHAMMTPEEQKLSQYQAWLSDDTRGKSPAPHPVTDDDGNEVEDMPGYYDEDELSDYNEGLQHENVASHLEHHVDRRAGVDPNMFASKFRERMQYKVDSGEGTLADDVEELYDPKSGAKNTVDRFGNRKSRGIPNEDIRNEAMGHTQRFDQGAKFAPNGTVMKPVGVDAAINARAGQEGRRWDLPARAGINERKANESHNARMARKAELKTSGGARGVKLPGQAAAPRPPAQPEQPQLAQTKPTTKQMANGAAGTQVKLPGVKPKKPTMNVTKSESANRCSMCGGAQFRSQRYVGCLCFVELAKSVRTTITDDGYTLEFGSQWDAEAIAVLAENLGK